MIEKRHILELKERVKNHRPPVLSLYATVNPARVDVNPQAVWIRVKNALKRVPELPPTVVERVERYFSENKLDSRSLLLFADEEGIEALPLSVEFLDDTSKDSVDLHWGEPHLTPLLVALDRFEPYAVVQVDRDRLRAFQVYMGEIKELWTAERDTVAEEEDNVEPSKSRLSTGVSRSGGPENRSPSTAGLAGPGPDFVADRGDASDQLAQENVRHAQTLFYKENGAKLAQVTSDRMIGRVILMGPDRDTHALRAQLPAPLRDKVAAVLPSLPRAVASPAEIFARVGDCIQQIETQKEQEMLALVRERGVWGLQACLEALQQGRLHTLAVPSDIHQDVFVDPETRLVTAAEAAKPADGATKMPLSDVLPKLAEAHGARLEFMQYEAQQALVEEFGGMAGLRRW